MIHVQLVRERIIYFTILNLRLEIFEFLIEVIQLIIKNFSFIRDLLEKMEFLEVLNVCGCK